MMMTLAEEKVLLETMRTALRNAPEGLTVPEMVAAVDDLTPNRCRRLLSLLIGQRFAMRTYEARSTKSNGQALRFYVYRVKPK
jgi:hypothetical protein